MPPDGTIGELDERQQAFDERRAETREKVIEKVGWPLDAWAVAATLESFGLRDVDAEEQFGSGSIFHLAETIYDEISNAPSEPTTLKAMESLTPWARLKSFIVYYCKGTLFAMPMATQIAAVLILRYSLWAWLDFSNLEATLVALGTIASFIVTGGFIQAIGREGTFYTGQKNWKLLEEVCRLIILTGTGLMLAVVLGFCVFNLFVPVLAWRYAVVSLTYFVLLSPMWLFLGVLFMLQDNFAIVLTTTVGTVAVHLMMTYTSYGIYAAHWIGLAVTNVVACGYGAFRIRKRRKELEKRFEKSLLPRSSVLLYIVLPFLVYGVLYFTFLNADRIIGWSAARGYLPLVIWFRTPYELGMDWALLSLVFTIAVLEYSVNEFSRTIIPVQEATKAADYKAHNRHYQRFYNRQRIMLAVVAVISVTITYFGVRSLEQYDHIKEVRDFFASPITYEVFWYAAISYSLLALGLLNSLFFFSLARPNVVVACIWPALVTNVVVGYVASRMISFEYSVLGLLAGSVVFAALTSRRASKLFRTLDFYYYSAF
ncbi:MAG: hypothetical protein AAGA54_11480 [Myxococcota bacterium]